MPKYVAYYIKTFPKPMDQHRIVVSKYTKWSAPHRRLSYGKLSVANHNFATCIQPMKNMNVIHVIEIAGLRELFQRLFQNRYLKTFFNKYIFLNSYGNARFPNENVKHVNG